MLAKGREYLVEHPLEVRRAQNVALGRGLARKFGEAFDGLALHLGQGLPSGHSEVRRFELLSKNLYSRQEISRELGSVRLIGRRHRNGDIPGRTALQFAHGTCLGIPICR